MRLQCQNCYEIIELVPEDLGTQVQCGNCHELVQVPVERFAPGMIVGDFLILQELGRGGMGIVFRAHQISLDRPAAVKILADSYAQNADFISGFIKEARAAAQLNHPHIVQAFAVGDEDGVYFFAMEFVDGQTMKHVLKEHGILDTNFALSVIQQIAEALDYAWREARLVHRDIKPDNIMLMSNGRAKLADLGLAKNADEASEVTDEVIGTPQYISPEQLTGAPVDNRSDIYSLGATFYHFVTGRFPFEADSAIEIAKKHLTDELIPPHLICSSVPENVSLVIWKMMAKNVLDRYQTAGELIEDLLIVRRGKIPPGVAALHGGGFAGKTLILVDNKGNREFKPQEKPINKKLIIGIVVAVVLLMFGFVAIVLSQASTEKEIPKVEPTFYEKASRIIISNPRKTAQDRKKLYEDVLNFISKERPAETVEEYKKMAELYYFLGLHEEEELSTQMLEMRKKFTIERRETLK